MPALEPPHSIPVVLGLLAACVLLSGGIMRALAAVAGPSRLLLAFLFAPGVAVHELAHAAACVLTGTRIRRIVVWNGSGGCVFHDRPRWLLLQPFISFFPLPVGIAVLGFAGRQFAEGEWVRNGALLLLMVSVAATLAPSREDWRQALAGSAVALAALLLAAQVHATWWVGMVPLAQELIPHLGQVVGTLIAILAALKILSAPGMRRGRRD